MIIFFLSQQLTKIERKMGNGNLLSPLYGWLYPGKLSLTDVSRAEVVALLSNPPPGFLLLDVREKSETDTGVITGARTLPLGNITAAFRLPPEQFKRYGFSKPSSTDPIVAYCHSGRRADMACSSLQAVGYTSCKVFRGGWGEWSRKITTD